MVTADFEQVSSRYDDLTLQGDRVLDRLTDDAIDDFEQADYHLVIRDQPYPVLETNTEQIGDLRQGVNTKGVFRLATVNVEDQEIGTYMSSIPEFADERKKQLETIADSVSTFNDQADEEWRVRGYFFPERAVYNVPSHDYGQGVYTTPEAMEEIRQSDAFAELSEDFFDGWLEISENTMLERR
jgi:hypothetical protein